MKIVCVDSFDRETRDELLIAENVPIYYARLIVEFLNSLDKSSNCPDFYTTKSDSYQLYKFEP